MRPHLLPVINAFPHLPSPRDVPHERSVFDREADVGRDCDSAAIAPSRVALESGVHQVQRCRAGCLEAQDG